MSSLQRCVVAALLGFSPGVARAQTDYYNTDAGRPIRTEDAHPVERRAFELQLAPLRMERAPGGTYTWGVEPELAYGFMRRTHLEIGFPLALVDAAGARSSGLAGVEVAMLHNLNAETSIPALAIAADVLLPAGGFGPDEAYPTVKGIMTKTLTWMRFHANGQYTFGDQPAATSGSMVHLSRWAAGLAADKTFPLRSLLLTAEVVTEQPIDDTEDLEWSAATGLRYQLTPRLAVDAGVGARLNGDTRPWFITFGSAYAFGMPWSPRR